MKKTIAIMALIVFVMSTFASGVAVEKFCTDSDSGKNVWSGGVATDEKGNNADDCDGESENLKEFFCDDDKVKIDNIKCSDFGAVCVSEGDKTVADYCACPKGYTYDARQEMCVDGDIEVPEFGTAGLLAAVMGAGLIIVALRKH